MFEGCVAPRAIPICGYSENLAQDITMLGSVGPVVARVYIDDFNQCCHQGPYGFPVSGSQSVTMLVSEGYDAARAKLSTGDTVSS